MAQSGPSFSQNLAWRLEAFGVSLVTALARAFPVDVVSDFGAWLVSRLGPLTSSHRVAERNLRIVFPEASDAEIARLLAEQWREIGRGFAEFPIMDRIAADPARIEVVGAERMKAIAEGGGPVVFISGHFSNFEVMAAAIVRAGIPCQVSYRATNNPYVDAQIRRSRFRYGIQMLAPKGTEGAREMMRALARGESVALMNDQKYNGGLALPFFGVTAYTAPGPSSFALRYGVPLQPLSVQRVRKARFKVIVHEPIRVENTGDRAADIEAAVRRVNAFVEERIRARPAEWFWVHKRWPNEVYKRG